MGNAEFSWTAFDRQHERAGEQDDDFDKHLAELTKRHAAAMRSNAITGHWQTLTDLADSLANRLSQRGNCETLIRAVLSSGPLTAGQQLLLMITNCIEDDAETAALVEMGRADRAGGLNFDAMRAVAPQEVLVPA